LVSIRRSFRNFLRTFSPFDMVSKQPEKKGSWGGLGSANRARPAYAPQLPKVVASKAGSPLMSTKTTQPAKSESVDEDTKSTSTSKLPTPTPTTGTSAATLPPGASLLDNFISDSEHNALLKWIDSQPWSTALARRVQEYGYTYHTRSVALGKQSSTAATKTAANGSEGDDNDSASSSTKQSSSDSAESGVGAATVPIPAVFASMQDRLVSQAGFPRRPDQLIINEYSAGQGIAPHIDHTRYFDEPIASISMLSEYPMVLDPPRGSDATPITLRLRRNSCLVLAGEARWQWKHSIPKRKSDEWSDGHKTQRSRRVSLTFRLMRQ